MQWISILWWTSKGWVLHDYKINCRCLYSVRHEITATLRDQEQLQTLIYYQTCHLTCGTRFSHHLWHGLKTDTLLHQPGWQTTDSFCEILQGSLSESNILGWKESYRKDLKPGQVWGEYKLLYITEIIPEKCFYRMFCFRGIKSKIIVDFIFRFYLNIFKHVRPTRVNEEISRRKLNWVW